MSITLFKYYIYHGGGGLSTKKSSRHGTPTEVCGAREAAELAPGDVAEVMVELLGEVPGEVLALPPRSCRRRQITSRASPN